jgi:hypothetical protein
MDKLREDGIEFHDRFDAMNKAFELLRAADLSLKNGPRA